VQIDFTGRRVLVTGSTSGIGFAAAESFLSAGADVVINGRSDASVDAALARLGGEQSSVAGFAGDLGSESACATICRASRLRHRRQQRWCLRPAGFLRYARQ